MPVLPSMVVTTSVRRPWRVNHSLAVGPTCRLPARTRLVDVLAVHVPVQQQDLDQRPGAGGVACALRAAAHQASWTGVNFPAARACTSAVAQGSAPGSRTSASR